MNNQLVTTINKIKKYGYWKVIFEPLSDKIVFEHPIEVKKFVDVHRVILRGWDFPHLPMNNSDKQGVIIDEQGFSVWTDTNHHIEAWTIYKSGQFVFVKGLYEDWLHQSDWFSRDRKLREIKPLTELDFVWTTLSFTEFFIFLKNILRSEKYKGEKLRVDITLNKLQNRQLTVHDPLRVPIFSERRATADKISLVNEALGLNDLEGENYLIFSRGKLVDFFKYFSWENPPVDVIEEDQKRLIERRLWFS